ncbi:hypothetical protein D3C76_761880 [compost metagenome]
MGVTNVSFRLTLLFINAGNSSNSLFLSSLERIEIMSFSLRFFTLKFVTFTSLHISVSGLVVTITSQLYLVFSWIISRNILSRFDDDTSSKPSSIRTTFFDCSNSSAAPSATTSPISPSICLK